MNQDISFQTLVVESIRDAEAFIEDDTPEEFADRVLEISGRKAAAVDSINTVPDDEENAVRSWALAYSEASQ